MKKLAILGVGAVFLFSTLLAACSSPTATPVPPTATPAPTATSVAAPTATPTLVAQATSAPTPVPKLQTFDFGATLPMTGVGSPWGIGCRNVLYMARDDINNAGGIKVGGQTYMVNLIIYDDQYQPGPATANVNRLIFTDHVKYIADFGGGVVPAIQAVTEPNKVIQAGIADGDFVLGAQDNYTFRILTDPTEQVHVLLPWIKQHHPNIKNVALLGQNTSSITALLALDKDEATRLGWTIVANDLEAATTTDFASAATKIMAANPDYVMVEASPAPLGLMLKALQGVGFTGVTSTLTGVDVTTMVNVSSKQAVEGLYSAFANWQSPLVPKNANDFYVRYMATYGPPFEVAANPTYTWLMVVKQAIEQAGTFDTDAVKKVMESPGFTFVTFDGTAQFGNCGGLFAQPHQAESPIYVSDVKNGALDTLEKVTPNWATLAQQ